MISGELVFRFAEKDKIFYLGDQGDHYYGKKSDYKNSPDKYGGFVEILILYIVHDMVVLHYQGEYLYKYRYYQ